jgi:hypothetical protein
MHPLATAYTWAERTAASRSHEAAARHRPRPLRRLVRWVLVPLGRRGAPVLKPGITQTPAPALPVTAPPVAPPG